MKTPYGLKKKIGKMWLVDKKTGKRISNNKLKRLYRN